VAFTCDNGASAVLEIGWASNIAGMNALFVLGTEAGLRFHPLTLIQAGRYSGSAVEERLLRGEDGDTRGFGDVTQQFVDGVLAGRQPYTPARDALEVTRVIAAAYRSAATGQAVQLA
jgi:predicted dehydrogenase